MPALSSMIHSRLLRSLALSLAGFLLILFGLNLYQYLRVRSDLATGLLAQIGDKEKGELQSFFKGIGSQLQMVRDWGKNGVLDSDDLISLNKKFFPILEHLPQISGLLLVDPRGHEYYLTRKGPVLQTCLTTPDKKGPNQLYQKWSTPDQELESWTKTSDYDPRRRPWYLKEVDRIQPHWTAPYPFSDSGRKGITASVSWSDTDQPNGHWVFAIDISLAKIQELMRRQNPGGVGVMFLVNTSGNTVIPGIPSSDQKEIEPIHRMLTDLVDQWIQQGAPAHKPLRYTFEKKSWVASLQPLLPQKTVFWIGLAAPEQELINTLGKRLFRIDLTDIVVATCGGLIMLLVIWKAGGFRGDRTSVDPVLRLHELINRGEGPNVEFKSTVRTNLKTGKKGKEIELAWLKAMVAFMNSRGGTLLIGVADDGRIFGLEEDAFDNDDRCLLHVKNLINQHIGAQFSGFVDVLLVEVEEKKVLMITVRRAGLPVFLMIGKNEEFYIRSGPSSIKLSPSQMISYVLQNRLTRELKKA